MVTAYSYNSDKETKALNQILYVLGISNIEVSLDIVFPEFYQVFCSLKKCKNLIKLLEVE